MQLSAVLYSLLCYGTIQQPVLSCPSLCDFCLTLLFQFLGCFPHEHVPLKPLWEVTFEVFTAVTMKNAVFWDVTPCGFGKNRRFGGA
jgi:hypothetical protein